MFFEDLSVFLHRQNRNTHSTVPSTNAYLQVEGLTYAVGDKTLFANLALGIAEGQRVGLIARNGTGKSSLLDIIAGRRQPDQGSIIWRRDLRVAYLEQTPTYPQELSVLEACLWQCNELDEGET